jgi:hypothetical protein
MNDLKNGLNSGGMAETLRHVPRLVMQGTYML